MYPKQEAAMFSSHRYSLIEASTKSGKTVSAIVWLAEQAMAGRKGANFWWVAPILTQAAIAFNRMRRRFPPGMIDVNLSRMTIRIIPVDTMIWFKGADHPDSLYGEDVYAAVIDEASRVKEEAFFAIRSTLTATRGPLRIIGNVKGRRNWFFKLSRLAERGEAPDMSFHKINAWDAVDAGVLDLAEIEDARRVLPEAVFKELYEAEASDDEGNPFGYAAIEACAMEGLSSEEIVCWGIDLARKHDYTVGIGLDRAGRVAGFFRFQKPWPEQVRLIRETVGRLPALVDATGIGDPVVSFLQQPVGGGGTFTIPLTAGESGSVDDWSRDGSQDEGDETLQALQRAFADTSIEGFLFTIKSKQMLMEGLAVAIQHGQTRFPREIEPGKIHPLKYELESFEYVVTRTGVRYSSPEGEWDDCVCALSLAVQCLNTRVASQVIDFSLKEVLEGFVEESLWDFGGNRGGGGGRYGGDTFPGSWNVNR